MLVAQSCPTLCNPMDCSPTDSSVHGILQARMLEWVAIPFSRGSSKPKDRTLVSCIAGRSFTIWTTREAQFPWRREWLPTPAFLPGEFHEQRSLEGYSPWGCKESDTTGWLALPSRWQSTNLIPHHRSPMWLQMCDEGRGPSGFLNTKMTSILLMQ